MEKKYMKCGSCGGKKSPYAETCIKCLKKYGKHGAWARSYNK